MYAKIAHDFKTILKLDQLLYSIPPQIDFETVMPSTYTIKESDLER
jgi:hypothetical protein